MPTGINRHNIKLIGGSVARPGSVSEFGIVSRDTPRCGTVEHAGHLVDRIYAGVLLTRHMDGARAAITWHAGNASAA